MFLRIWSSTYFKVPISHFFLFSETRSRDIIFKFTNVNENLESIYVLLSGLLNLCFRRFRIVHNFLTTQRKPHSAIWFTHWAVLWDICDVFLASTGCCHSIHLDTSLHENGLWVWVLAATCRNMGSVFLSTEPFRRRLCRPIHKIVATKERIAASVWPAPGISLDPANSNLRKQWTQQTCIKQTLYITLTSWFDVTSSFKL